MSGTQWTYVALDPSGDARSGVIDASSESEAARVVSALGLRPMKVNPARRPVIRRDFTMPSLGVRVGPSEVAAAIRQLATMLGAGVTLRRSLVVLSEQATNQRLEKALTDVRDGVEAGESLSEAFSRHPDVFGPIVVALVRAGESAGALDTVLEQAADTLERQAALRRQVRSTLAYPISVLVLVTLVVIAMSLFVVPVFRDVYADLGQDLPLATRIVLSITGFIGSNALVLGLASALAVIGLRRYRQTSVGRRRVDRALLAVPALGSLLRQAALARTARSLSVLVRSGVPIVDAIEVTSSTVGNEVLAEVIRETSESIQTGQPLSEPLSRSDQIPPLFAQVVAVGEESGDLEEMLDVVAGVYDDGVDSVSATFSAVIEPIMIGGLGAIVGGLVLALYLPMFRLVDIVQ